jgi:hypothetical protein
LWQQSMHQLMYVRSAGPPLPPSAAPLASHSPQEQTCSDCQDAPMQSVQNDQAAYAAAMRSLHRSSHSLESPAAVHDSLAVPTFSVLTQAHTPTAMSSRSPSISNSQMWARVPNPGHHGEALSSQLFHESADQVLHAISHPVAHLLCNQGS